MNSIISVPVTTTDVTNVNFGIQQPPTANDVTASSQLNPGGTTQVSVPTLTGSDPEDGTYNGTSGTNDIIIQTVPNPTTQGNLYYNGVLVTAGQTITDYNPSLLTVDPVNGTVTVIFTYSEIDAAGAVSPAATVTMPFAPLSISGNVYNDADALTDGNLVDGTAIDGTTTVVYANLVSGGNVVQSVQVSSTGTYTFPNVTPNTTYTVILTTTSQSVGAALSSATIPSGYVSTGENIGAGTGSDGTVNSIISVPVTTTDVTNVNFGIQQPPTANDVTASSQLNPGGTTQVSVPTLTGSDPEDGTYNGTSGTNDIIIQTVPNPTTQGNLYYNGVLVTAGQTITDYNPSLLTVDPVNGTVTVIFTYSEIDAAGAVSPAATVTMPFAPLSISGNVYNDADALTDGNLVDGTAIDGTTAPTVVYANLVSGGNVVQSVQVSATGTYTFPNVTPNTTYTVILTTTSQSVGAALSSATIPSGYVSTGENIGAGTGSDGTVNSIISVPVTTTDVTNVNFGIRSPLIDLSVTKTANNLAPTIGSTVTFTITVTNAVGYDTATGVSVTDVVPSGFSNITNISNSGVLSGNTITWSGLTINSGASVNLTFTATVLASGSYNNMAQVSAADLPDFDSTPNNSVSTEDDQDDVNLVPATNCDARQGTWIE